MRLARDPLLHHLLPAKRHSERDSTSRLATVPLTAYKTCYTRLHQTHHTYTYINTISTDCKSRPSSSGIDFQLTA